MKSTEHPLGHIHDPTLDPMLGVAYRFVTNKLGLPTTHLDRVVAYRAPNSEAERVLPGVFSAHDRLTGDITVGHVIDPRNPAGADLRFKASAVHEFAHGADHHSDDVHPFYSEAIAGLAEMSFLEDQRRRGVAARPAAFMLHRAGVVVRVPGAFRLYDVPGPEFGSNANSSQAMVAAAGLTRVLRLARQSPLDVLGAVRQGPAHSYGLMERVIQDVRPGLHREISSLPTDTDGVIQATALVQQAASQYRP